jgi:hypothetical protein
LEDQELPLVTLEVQRVQRVQKVQKVQRVQRVQRVQDRGNPSISKTFHNSLWI